MKKILLLLVVLCCGTAILEAQDKPLGMRYQAIARDMDGTLIAHQAITAKVEMLTIGKDERLVYQEVHNVTSNEFGLLNLTIGEGESSDGNYNDIPWSTQNVWVRISVKRDTDTDYKVVTTNKLYSVPYANYAAKAGSLVEDDRATRAPGSPSGGATWSLRGNKNADKHMSPPKLGPTDSIPFILITNDEERLRIGADGTISIVGDLDVGEDAIIGMDLTVKQDVFLNTEGGSTTIDGPTTIGGPGMNQTTMTGNVQIDKDLNVDGATNLDSTVNVNGDGTFNGENTLGGVAMNQTTMTGNARVDKDLSIGGTLDLDSTLNVSGVTNLKDSLNVDGVSNLNGETNIGGPGMNLTTFTGDVQMNKKLNVDGHTTMTDSLTVSGPATFDINVTGDQTDKTSYPVLIKGSKQGLAIDLIPDITDDNCTQSHRGNNYISFWRDTVQKGRIEGMGRADLDPTGLLSLFTGMIQDPPAALTGSGIGVTYDPFSVMSNNITSILGFDDGNLPTLNNTLDFSKGTPASFLEGIFSGGSVSDLDGIGSLGLINGILPSIGNNFNFTNPFGGNQVDPIGGIIEGFNPFTCDGTSPANAVWGTIKNSLMNSGMYPADPTNFESQIFSNYTLDVLQQGIGTLSSFVELVGSLASIMDPEDIFSEGVGLVADVVSLIIYGAYSDINLGVAYESGAGDYAEWLRRANPNEMIRPGDVVGVIGGQISKNFSHADRFMVVSTSPLLLGNMPANAQEEYLHEKIAFVGQVPVKVIGAVNIGDYILPSGSGDGVAIAVSPEDMLARDYQRIVGVAWEANTEDEFIKLVNVAVGINHNDMSKLIEQMQFTMNHIQASLAKLDPTFEAHFYEVSTTSFTASSLDYTVAPTHESNVSSYFANKSYDSKAEMLADVKHMMQVQAGIDLSQFPLVEYVFDNPHQAKNVLTEYQTILDDMELVRDQMIADR